MATVSVPGTLQSFTDLWSPRLVAAVNDHHVKVAKLDGEFVFHSHPDTDELFYLLSGKLTMEIEGAADVEIGEGEVYVVPRGVRHRPVARDARVVLIEKDGTVNTGDAPPSELTNAVKDARAAAAAAASSSQ